MKMQESTTLPLNRLIFTLLISTVIPIFSGCGMGTGTGNPKSALQSYSSVSASLIGGTCAVIWNCHGIGINSCFDALKPLTTFGPRLGVEIQPPLTVLEIIDQEQIGQLTPSNEAANQCAAKLNALDCSDPAVANAYIPGNIGHEFDLAHEILDPVCTGVFGSH
jgi:hypothetical protein